LVLFLGIVKEEQFLKRVGANIKRIRTSNALHPARLAIQVGLPLGSIEMIEEGLVLTNLFDILLISEALKVDPVDLFR
jgi:hypothetical protein